MPNRRKLSEALAKLKFMVVIDPLDTETASFWQNHGEFNDVKTADIQTEVFRLPASCFAEHSGTFTNPGASSSGTGRPPTVGRGDDGYRHHREYLHARARAVPENGGAFPAPVLGLTWPIARRTSPRPKSC